MNKMKLFCIPYAGGSAMMYSKWIKYLDRGIEVVPIELSGRGSRFDEPLYNNLNDAVDDVYDQIVSELRGDQPYAVFGHSMGAVIAYELYYKLVQSHKVQPEIMVFSGREAPHINIFEEEQSKISHLSDEQFLEAISTRYQGVSEAFLQNKELVDLFLPVLRADFQMIEKYSYSSRTEKIDCDVTILNGLEDYTNLGNVNDWKQYTNKSCSIHHFAGGHFFIDSNMQEVNETLNNQLIREDVYL